ncbi:hypothetical protein A4G27_16650 [Mycobacterium kansasii]|nr:hypothetical protein A4G27_16650 [Mycobacterium kansasii]
MLLKSTVGQYVLLEIDCGFWLRLTLVAAVNDCRPGNPGRADSDKGAGLRHGSRFGGRLPPREFFD